MITLVTLLGKGYRWSTARLGTAQKYIHGWLYRGAHR